jgi:hypothetical protein
MKFALAAASAALLLAACGAKTEPTLDGAPSAAAPVETAAAPAAPAGAIGPAAGKWKVSVSAGGMEIPPNEICYAKQMSMEEAQKMQQQSGLTCTEQTFSSDGKSGHSVCSMQGMTVTTDYAVTGDFSTAYTMQMTSTMDPSPSGMPSPSVTTLKMERLGDCDPGTAPAPTP